MTGLLALVSCLRIAWMLPRLLYFDVLDFMTLISDQSLLFAYIMNGEFSQDICLSIQDK